MTTKQLEALQLADALDSIPDCQCSAWSSNECACGAAWPDHFIKPVAAMLRQMYVQNNALQDNLEKKSIAIQRIWKERDDLRKRQVENEAVLRKALEFAEAQCENRCNAEQNPCWARDVAAAIKDCLK